MSNRKIIFLFSLIYLFSIVNSLELNNICNEINFENKVVNHVYKLKLEYQLPSIDAYLFRSENEELKNQYDNFLNELFTEKFWIDGNISEKINIKSNEILSIKDKLNISKTKGFPLIYSIDHSRNHWPSPRYNSKAEEIKRTFDRIDYLLKNLTKLNQNYLTKDILPTNELINILRSLNLDDNQESVAVFKNKFINVFYNQPIVSFEGIKINRNQNMFLDSSATSSIQYSIYIPFFDKSVQTYKSNCLSNDMLPKFYNFGEKIESISLINSFEKLETTTKDNKLKIESSKGTMYFEDLEDDQ